MSSGPDVQDSLTYFEKSQEYGTLAETFMTVIGGIFVSAGAILASIGDAGAGMFIMILDAFGLGGRQIVLAFTEDPAGFIGDSFEFAAQSWNTSAWGQLGPFVPLLAGAVVVGFFALIIWYLAQSDQDVPIIGEIPFVGASEADPDLTDEEAS